MTTEVQLLQRIAVTEESAANFASDLTGSATYLDVPFQEGTATLTLTKAILEPLTVQQYIDGLPKTVIGPQEAQLDFTMVLASLGTAFPASTVSLGTADSALLTVLKAVFGGIRSGNDGSTVDTASSASQLNVQAGDGANWTHGAALARARDSDGFVELREIQTVATDAITLKHDLSDTPSASDVIYNATTIYPTENPTTTLQFIVEGAEQDDRWLVYGAQLAGPPSLTMTIGELPTITFSFNCRAWKSLSGQAITAATYDNFAPVYSHGEFLAQVAGTATRQILAVSEVSFTLRSPTYQPIMSPSGKNDAPTSVGFRRMRQVQGFGDCMFSLAYEATTWFTERDDRDDYHLMWQVGTAAGGIVAIVFPTAQIIDVQRTDADGLAYQQVTARARLDTDTPSQLTQILRAPMRIHFA
jgi:hypothetical protein